MQVYYELMNERSVQSVQDRITSKVTEVFTATGKTQEGFAAQINVSKRAVAYWLAGERIPTVANLIEMARIHNKDVSWFFLEEDYELARTDAAFLCPTIIERALASTLKLKADLIKLQDMASKR